MTSRLWLLPLACATALIVGFPGLPVTTQNEITLVSIYVLLISGTNLTFGYAGEFVFSHVAMFAAGAYFGGYLGLNTTPDLLLSLPIAALGAMAIALVTGVPSFRLGGWSLAMLTFFLVLMIPDLVALTKEQSGGYDGLSGIPLPTLGGIELDATGLSVVIVVITCLWIAVMRNIVVSRHGTAMRVMRESPILAQSLGISIVKLKLAAYLLSGIPTGLAGCLFAYQNTLVAPDYFSFTTAVALIAGSIIGGMISVYGAVVGAVLVQIIPLRFAPLAEYAPIVYGSVLILSGVFLPTGMAGLAWRLWRRRGHRCRSSARLDGKARQASEVPKLDGKNLEIDSVTVSFGGARVLDGVSVEARPGEITAIIGPNGSGKTTLLNVISGLVKPESGSVAVGGERVDGRAPHRVARQGVARTFQTPIIPPDMEVADVVAIARYERPYLSLASAVLRLPRFRRTRRDDRRSAVAALAHLGEHQSANRLAHELPLGGRRLVEVARSLNSNPSAVLLDEPASALNAQEVDELASTVRKMRDAGATIVLVEHNFRFVLSVADVIHVLHMGQLLASGAPHEIATDQRVIDVYLGKRQDLKSTLDRDSL